MGNYAPQLTMSILLNLFLILYFFVSTHDLEIVSGKKIKIGNAVYQCVKKQELNLE